MIIPSCAKVDFRSMSYTNCSPKIISKKTWKQAWENKILIQATQKAFTIESLHPPKIFIDPSLDIVHSHVLQCPRIVPRFPRTQQ